MKKLLLTLLLGMMFTTSTQAETDITGIQDFVSRFYVEVLDRTPDQAGLDDWVNRLASGESAGSDVATGFVFSQEFTNRNTDNILFLNILYRAFFDREADSGGFNTWLEQLTQGTSREDVLNGFLYSTEFDNLCKVYGIKAVPNGVEEFVKRFYSEVLGRTADAAGLTDWVNRLNTKIATGADIANGFIFSAEFTNRNTDDVTFIHILYRAFFAREADEGGFNGWLSQLEQGISREDVLNGFLHSEEFVNLCDGYGIIAYIVQPVVGFMILPDGTTEYSVLIGGETIYLQTASDISDPATYNNDTFNALITQLTSDLPSLSGDKLLSAQNLIDELQGEMVKLSSLSAAEQLELAKLLSIFDNIPSAKITENDVYAKECDSSELFISIGIMGVSVAAVGVASVYGTPVAGMLVAAALAQYTVASNDWSTSVNNLNSCIFSPADKLKAEIPISPKLPLKAKTLDNWTFLNGQPSSIILNMTFVLDEDISYAMDNVKKITSNVAKLYPARNFNTEDLNTDDKQILLKPSQLSITSISDPAVIISTITGTTTPIFTFINDTSKTSNIDYFTFTLEVTDEESGEVIHVETVNASFLPCASPDYVGACIDYEFGDYIYITPYVDGVKEGISLWYHANYIIISKTPYVNGLKHGREYSYNYEEGRAELCCCSIYSYGNYIGEC